jgi:hypothetical protein
VSCSDDFFTTEVFGMKRFVIPGALLLLAAAVGCSQKPDGSAGGTQHPPAPGPEQVGGLEAAVMSQKPANAISVREALTRKEGEKVVVSGRVPPEKLKPYNAAVAAVLLMAPEDLDREDVKSEFDCDDAAT